MITPILSLLFFAAIILYRANSYCFSQIIIQSKTPKQKNPCPDQGQGLKSLINLTLSETIFNNNPITYFQAAS